MLALSSKSWLEIMAESWRVYPLEACGLLVASAAKASALAAPPSEASGLADDRPIVGFLPINNAAQSSRIFELDPMGYLKAERQAEEQGQEVVGVLHSHTHTAAYPSPTDVSEAIKPLIPPSWHWAIVSLGWGYPELRSFRVNSPKPGDTTSDWLTRAGIAEEQVLLT